MNKGSALKNILKRSIDKHIFNKNTVSLRLRVDKNMRNRTDKFSVLQYRASRHTLNYPSGYFEELRIGDFYYHVFCFLRA